MIRRFIDGADHIYLVTGVTDFRKQIQGLSTIVCMQFQLGPFQGSAVFLFCNKKRDAIKVLRFYKNGFILVTKKLMANMRFQWARNTAEAKEITMQQVGWLLQGLEIEQKKVLHEIKTGQRGSCY